MDELELVEKLREKANVSFAEAKEALNASGGDILDAIIYLEKQGKTIPPPGGGYYNSGSGAQDGSQSPPPGSGGSARDNGESFWSVMRHIGRFCLKLINQGNNNFLDASKNGEVVLSCPVTAFAILLIFFFWIVLPLIVVSLFFGYRYSFRGAELGREDVNNVIDSAANMAEELKNSFKQKAEEKEKE